MSGIPSDSAVTTASGVVLMRYRYVAMCVAHAPLRSGSRSQRHPRSERSICGGLTDFTENLVAE